MKKVIYELHYKDFVGRNCVREYESKCIIYVMDKAKKFVQVNHIQIAKIITPSGKVYHV